MKWRAYNLNCQLWLCESPVLPSEEQDRSRQTISYQGKKIDHDFAVSVSTRKRNCRVGLFGGEVIEPRSDRGLDLVTNPPSDVDGVRDGGRLARPSSSSTSFNARPAETRVICTLESQVGVKPTVVSKC